VIVVREPPLSSRAVSWERKECGIEGNQWSHK
jgi:hypothetical protein